MRITTIGELATCPSRNKVLVRGNYPPVRQNRSWVHSLLVSASLLGFPRSNSLSNSISKIRGPPSALDRDRERRDICMRVREVCIKCDLFSTLTHILLTMSPMGKKPGRARFLRLVATRCRPVLKCTDFTSANRLARRKCAQCCQYGRFNA
jgi:hypothetical protein